MLSAGELAPLRGVLSVPSPCSSFGMALMVSTLVEVMEEGVLVMEEVVLVMEEVVSVTEEAVDVMLSVVEVVIGSRFSFFFSPSLTASEEEATFLQRHM